MTNRQILFRPEEAAAILGVGRTKFYELVRRGLIETVAIDGCTRVTRRALNAYVDSLPTRVPPSRRSVGANGRGADSEMDALPSQRMAEDSHGEYR